VGMLGVAVLGLCSGKLVHCDHLHHCSFGEQDRSLLQEVLMVWDHVDLTHPLRDPCGLEDPWALVLPFVQVVQLVLQEDPLASA